MESGLAKKRRKGLMICQLRLINLINDFRFGAPASQRQSESSPFNVRFYNVA